MCYIIDKPTPSGYFAANQSAVILQCFTIEMFNVFFFGPEHVNDMPEGFLDASYTLDMLKMVPCAI